jgi:hypothetical protein
MPSRQSEAKIEILRRSPAKLTNALTMSRPSVSITTDPGTSRASPRSIAVAVEGGWVAQAAMTSASAAAQARGERALPVT